jgi:hypothetical protein
MVRPAYVGSSILILTCAVLATEAVQATGPGRDQKHATLNLTASPVVSFAPARILLTAKLEGGPDDDEQLYCPALEWDWGDDTTSEASADCSPFERGKTTIQRRFTIQHVYSEAGEYRVQLTLKRNAKPISSAVTTLELKPGMVGGH